MKAHTYRKKPVLIYAIQYTGDNADEVKDFIRQAGEDVDSIIVGGVDGIDEDLYIETLEGVFHVSPTDYIICGVENEFYPCKESIFHQTYELIK